MLHSTTLLRQHLSDLISVGFNFTVLEDNAGQVLEISYPNYFSPDGEAVTEIELGVFAAADKLGIEILSVSIKSNHPVSIPTLEIIPCPNAPSLKTIVHPVVVTQEIITAQ